MNFRTEIILPDYPFSISHKDAIISFGSCFSENMGEKLSAHKFDILVNPYGILFNPISVSKAIEECVLNKKYTDSELTSNNEIHFSFNHHSKFSGLNKAEIIENINKSIAHANSYLSNANVVILTLGTAWVYRLKETSEVVANCYKLPAQQFNKELLSIKEIVDGLNHSINKLKAINPAIQIITAVSPVRHWKDGVVENQQSKSTLHLALKQINDSNENCHYFPSFEIMMDELRDYRFYEEDMLHPSNLAIDYIWKKFSNSFFSKETKELNTRISQLTRDKNHKPFNPESEEFRAFSKQLIEKESKLFSDYPYLVRN